MPEHEIDFSVFTEATTLAEYLRGQEPPYDDIPNFISPGWLMRLEQRGLLAWSNEAPDPRALPPGLPKAPPANRESK